MIIRLKRAVIAYILGSALLPAFWAHPATYYVATTGSDSHPGTKTQPWRTIAQAANAMVAGDTTYVKGGTYEEGFVRFTKSGTSSAPIQLVNAPGESPVIQCINPTAYQRIEIMPSKSGPGAVGWITIEGFEIRNCWEAIKFRNIHDVTIRRNWMHDNLNQGFLGNGTRVLFDRNIVNHNGPFLTKPTSTLAHGLYVNGTAWTITNNLIYDNLGFGIQLNGSSSSLYDAAKHPSPEFAVSANWVVANNTIAYNRNAAGMVVWGSTCNNARIENNIFYENAVTRASNVTQGIHFTSPGCTGVQIRNNHFYASGSGGTVSIAPGAIEGVHYMQSGNIINVSDPRFVNAPADLPASPKFSLTERSPAIDAGLTNVATKIAFDGTTRPQGRAYDIGAYEYSAGNDARSPARPAGLQVH